MNTEELIEVKIKQAANAISEADGLLITAGAGMGVDSGLPDFRGTEGFWNAYPALGKRNIDFQSIACPQAFHEDPTLAWGFYGHRLNLYRKTVPHDGFRILREMAEKLPNGAFVATSNVDGQFQKAGFSEQRIYEVHGSIHRMRCLDDNCATWSAQTFSPKVDEVNCRLISALPRCGICGGFARPNILMFADWDWNDGTSEIQQKRLNAWLAGVSNLVTIEIGAGKNIPTIRNLVERLDGLLIRINPRDYWVNPGKDGVSLPVGALEGLRGIEAAIMGGDEYK
jgi:NAD-dependent SIR2 family protein deacetylase